MKIKFTILIIFFNINFLFSNNFTYFLKDSVNICKVKIAKIEYSKKDSIFFINAVNIETNERYLIVSNSKKCKCKVYKQRLETGRIYSLEIKYIFGSNQIISNNDLRLYIYKKPIKLPGFYFSHGIICYSPTIDSDFCIQYRHH